MKSVFESKEEARDCLEQLIADINYKIKLNNRDIVLVSVGERVKVVTTDGLVVIPTCSLDQAFTTLCLIKSAFWVGVSRAERGAVGRAE